MARRSFVVRDVVEIFIHWQSGRPIREIARSLGVDRNTIRKHVNLALSLGYQPRQTNLTAQEWSAVVRQYFPELTDPASKSSVFTEISRFQEAIVEGLKTNRASTVWQRLHDEKGLRASLRSFRRYLDIYVPDRAGKPQPTVLRDDPPPGKEAQIDFGYLGVWTDPATGKKTKLYAFVMVLSYSRHMFVYVVTKMDQRAWLKAHVAAFAFFGGVPDILVIDNLTSGVLHADLYDPQLNRGYEQMATYYGTLIDPCRAVHPKDKPRVERMIPYVRDSYYAGRTFASLDEMNEAAEKWCLSVAGERIHGAIRQQPLRLFQQVEAARLRSLPPEPFELVTWVQCKVADDCHSQVLRGIYSIPHRYVTKTLDARISDTTVEFYLDRELVKTHLRLHDGGRRTDWNDYPPEKAQFFQRHPDWCRTKAAKLGPEVAQVVEHLLSLHALHYLRQCQGIIGLTDKYGAPRVDAACQRANAFGDPSYKTVKTILEKGLEGQLALDLASVLPKRAGAYLHGPEQLFAAVPHLDNQEEPNG
ncbi:MAG: IS21 family transposase [Dehalococcoidia bacterium]|nr:IS21 family transposase [Dehalococcoidia bacterium]